ncbi:hypothetical protein ACFTSD_05275 [Nocardiaceae bacterium NPDC056970]
MTRLARYYGAGPLHLVAVLFCFALIGYSVSVTGLESFWNPDNWWQSIAVWFAGAIIAHDLVLYPIYSLGDRSLSSGLDPTRRHRHARERTVPPLNYVRVPALGTALTFLMFFPGILQRGADTYLAATGQTQEPFLVRWILLSVAMFGISALIYAVRVIRARRRGREVST